MLFVSQLDLLIQKAVTLLLVDINEERNQVIKFNFNVWYMLLSLILILKFIDIINMDINVGLIEKR
jgi:hypothetical protein